MQGEGLTRLDFAHLLRLQWLNVIPAGFESARVECVAPWGGATRLLPRGHAPYFSGF